jgi:hypothetical protein
MGWLVDVKSATVNKIVDTYSPKFHKVQQPRSCKLLNLKMRKKGAQLRPRRIPASRESALFSAAFVSMICGRLVEPCRGLLKLSAFRVLNFIYSRTLRKKSSPGCTHRESSPNGHVTPAASARCRWSWTVPEANRAISWLANDPPFLKGGCLPFSCPAPLALSKLIWRSRTRFGDRPKTVRLYPGISAHLYRRRKRKE